MRVALESFTARLTKKLYIYFFGQERERGVLFGTSEMEEVLVVDFCGILLKTRECALPPCMDHPCTYMSCPAPCVHVCYQFRNCQSSPFLKQFDLILLSFHPAIF